MDQLFVILAAVPLVASGAGPSRPAGSAGPAGPLLVVSSSGQVPVPAGLVAEKTRFLLAPSGFRVAAGPELPPGDFPEQVRRARLLGARRRAAAVAWYRVVQVAGRPVLFLHVLDFLTDKTLVRTVQVSQLDWRAPEALARALALKTWSLLRASFLETRITRRPVPRAVKRLTRLPRAGGPAVEAPVRRGPPRFHLRVAYGLGGFSSGLGPYHGPAAEALVRLWGRSALALWAGGGLDVTGHLAVDLSEARVEASLWPLAGLLELRWVQGRLGLAAGVRAGVMVLDVRVWGPGGMSLLRWDPALGGHAVVAWRLWRGLWAHVRFVAQGVLAEQCFRTQARTACFGRARLAGSLGLSLSL